MEELLGRIKTAIEFLKDGLPFRVDRLYMGISEDGYLNITGVSQHIDSKYISKQSALLELEDIKYLFDKMVSISEELKDFAGGKQLKFNLDFDYGMGSVRICSEMNGLLKWEYDVK